MTTQTLEFTNNAITTLAAGITAASPSLQVVGGGGSLFPAIGTSTQFAFYATLIKNGSPNIFEIILVEGRTGDNFTNIIRGADNTTALSWSAGDTVAMFPVAGMMNSFPQYPQAQAQSFNFAIDTGAANSYQGLLTPALNGHVFGMPIRFHATHTNTGPSVFSDGIGVAPLLTPQLQQLPPGAIVAGGHYTAVWDSTEFQLITYQSEFFSQLLGSIAAGQVPLAAVQQYQSNLAIAFTQLTGQIANGQILASANLTGSPTSTTPANGDVSSRIATTGFCNPGGSFGATGYRMNTDGTIDQWGVVSTTHATGNPIDVGITFPIAFPSICYGVSPTTQRTFAGGAAAAGSNFASSITTSGAVITIDSVSVGSTSYVARWFAKGK